MSTGMLWRGLTSKRSDEENLQLSCFSEKPYSGERFKQRSCGLRLQRIFRLKSIKQAYSVLLKMEVVTSVSQRYLSHFRALPILVLRCYDWLRRGENERNDILCEATRHAQVYATFQYISASPILSINRIKLKHARHKRTPHRATWIRSISGWRIW